MPSNTALTAAAARAAHLIVDDPPHIFADTFAAALLGDRADELLGYHRENATHPILSVARTQVICRSRYAENALASAAADGVRQYVLLGAGLDSFSCRAPLASQLRIFEVDHLGMQQWKREALAAAGLAEPASATFIPADLGRDSLADALSGAGFDFAKPAVISWLGVVMYLPLADIEQVLSCVARCAPGSQLIADYMLPEALRDAAGNDYVRLVGAVAAERGEPWQTFLGPSEASELLAAHGPFAVEQLRQRDLVPAPLWQRTDSLRPIDLSMVVRATVTGWA